jgi:hypothetical protein
VKPIPLASAVDSAFPHNFAVKKKRNWHEDDEQVLVEFKEEKTGRKAKHFQANERRDEKERVCAEFDSKHR